MYTYTIFIGSIAWDEVRATSKEEALELAKARHPVDYHNDVWVRRAGRS